jgi:hypothetical protein
VCCQGRQGCGRVRLEDTEGSGYLLSRHLALPRAGGSGIECAYIESAASGFPSALRDGSGRARACTPHCIWIWTRIWISTRARAVVILSFCSALHFLSVIASGVRTEDEADGRFASTFSVPGGGGGRERLEAADVY